MNDLMTTLMCPCGHDYACHRPAPHTGCADCDCNIISRADIAERGGKLPSEALDERHALVSACEAFAQWQRPTARDWDNAAIRDEFNALQQQARDAIAQADGEIKLGTPAAIRLGFTPDKFQGYLWRTANRITISSIISRHPGQGNLSSLFERILSLGYNIAVPTPSNRMRTILKAKGFIQTWEKYDLYHVELWVKTSSTQCELQTR